MGQARPDELTQDGGADNTVERTPTAEAPLVPFTDGSAEPTVLGTTIGTPAFMSPEQAAARFDLLGPASDVFSLGATLYQVLTGKPPYEGPDALRQAEAGDFDRPRTIKPQIPRPLEAICLRAMATRPKERYSSTRELAKDLERFLADEHVLAHEESPAERLSRWSRRNRTWFRAGVWALVAISAVSVVFAVLILRALVDARTQRALAEAESIKAQRLAEDERTQREKAQTLATEKAALADKMVALASEKSALAEFLVGTFQANDPIGLGGVSFFISKTDDEKLTAVEILNRGAQRVRTDPQLATRPMARAGVLDAIGDAYRQIGDFPTAKQLLVEALEIRRRELSPDDPDLAATCFHLGAVYHETGDYPRARPLYEEALRIRREIPGEEGTRLTAAALRNLGWMLANEGNTDAAERIFREALSLPLAPDGRPNREVAFAKFGLAFTMVEQGRRVPALAMALDARREWERAEKNPQLSRAAAALVLGVVYREIPGMLALSEAKLHESIDAVTAVLGKDYYITGLCQFELAKTLADRGKDEEAERVFREARRICTQGDFFQHPRTILFAHEYGRFLNDHGRLPEAKGVWNEFVQGQKRRFGPTHRFVAEAQRQQARFLYDNGDAASATHLLEECVAMCRGLDPPDEWQLGCALANLGHCRLRDGSRAWLNAEAELKEALQLLEESKSTERKKRLEETLFYEAEAWIALGRALVNQNQLDEADRAFQSGRRAAAGYPGFGDDRRHLLNQALGHHAGLLRRTLEIARAADASLERKGLWRGIGGELYLVATELAQCGELASGQPDQLTAEQRALQLRCRREALSALREAVDAGFKNKATIVGHASWKALENEPEFQAILSELGS
jgi:tetratricopeptide (TPR) repeat protein